mgnify:CR=1 FL=1
MSRKTPEKATKPDIRLFNTMTRKVEPFSPIKPGKVGIYTCGPTVYHDAHIGNMRAFLFADILKKMFVYAGYSIDHVMNITDVGHLTDDADEGEDKMLVAMRREGMSAWDIAEKYTRTFLRHMAELNIQKPAFMPKATDHIKEQIQMVRTLEGKGYTYKTADGIYFDTSKIDNYGELAKLNIEGLKAGERVDLGDKKNITDFALWKFSPPDAQRDMEWDSPWGKGFPGWHLECSAMSARYLGNHFDIHTGGIDHIPVHHTNEIAQSECAHGEKFVNYWMHVAFLNMKDGAKMSKSSGKFITLDTLKEKGFSPLAYRYFCLMCHYRQGLDFDWEGLGAAAKGHKRLCRQVQQYAVGVDATQVHLGQKAEEYARQMDANLFEDLNTAKVLASLWTLLDDNNLKDEEKAALAARFDTVLGLETATYQPQEADVPPNVAEMVTAREAARQNRDFAKADALRDEITAAGYSIEDTQEGTKVRPA